MKRTALFALLVNALAILFAENRMEISVEKKGEAGPRAIDPRHVLEPGDLVRFRFRANFAGYLYVMNHSTSGKYMLLFPTAETGTQNRIEPDKNYMLPAAESGWFRIEGPAGHEIVYWLITPAALSGEKPLPVPLPLPKPMPPAQGMTPRCDDTIFRARGECIDTTAGPRPVRRGETLPGNLTGASGAAARDLVFIRKQNLSLISSPDSLAGPVIYEFSLAHK